MSKRSLRHEVGDLRILHTRFVQILTLLKQRIDAVIAGGEPKISWVIGPSRVGKTALIEALMLYYLQRVMDGRTRIPVLRVETPSLTTPHLLPISVLEALQVPYPGSHTSTGKYTQLAVKQLKKAETKALLFEEASQMVELGAKITPYDVSEWQKGLINETQIAQLLFGVPRLQRLINANNQLRGRSHRVIRWLPYDASNQSEWQDYVATFRQLLVPFERRGWLLEPTEAVAAANLYLHAPGLIGALCDVIKELANQLEHETPGALTLDMFRRACDSLEPLGHPKFPAFTTEPLNVAVLREASLHVVSKSEEDAQ